MTSHITQSVVGAINNAHYNYYTKYEKVLDELDSDFNTDVSDSGSSSESEDEFTGKSRYNLRSKGIEQVYVTTQDALSSNRCIDADSECEEDYSPAQLVTDTTVGVSGGSITGTLVAVALAIVAVAGIYFGAKAFSENTQVVKELCDDKIALVKQQEIQISKDAVEGLDNAFQCTSARFQVITNPLSTWFPIFREAASNLTGS